MGAVPDPDLAFAIAADEVVLGLRLTAAHHRRLGATAQWRRTGCAGTGGTSARSHPNERCWSSACGLRIGLRLDDFQQRDGKAVSRGPKARSLQSMAVVVPQEDVYIRRLANFDLNPYISRTYT
jgi:hypothetical protein